MPWPQLKKRKSKSTRVDLWQDPSYKEPRRGRGRFRRGGRRQTSRGSQRERCRGGASAASSVFNRDNAPGCLGALHRALIDQRACVAPLVVSCLVSYRSVSCMSSLVLSSVLFVVFSLPRMSLFYPGALELRFACLTCSAVSLLCLLMCIVLCAQLPEHSSYFLCAVEQSMPNVAYLNTELNATNLMLISS